jgi:hypothetical protein
VRVVVRFGSFLAPLLAATDASACPLCNTGTGDAVRAGIVADFSGHLLAIVAPFPVLIAAVALLHRGWPPWRSRS